MKINLGCASEPLSDYINVDMDSLDDLRVRYPHKEFSNDLVVEQWDIFNLPVQDNSVDEIRADCLFEHLSFKEEKKIFEEVKRVLKIGGVLNLAVPDIESVFKKFFWQQRITGGIGIVMMSKPLKKSIGLERMSIQIKIVGDF